MVQITKNEDVKRRIVRKKSLFFSMFLGIGLLTVAIMLLYFNPVLLIVQQKLRLENGSMLNEVLLGRFTSTKMYLYVFNVTNSERFLAGDDEKIKLEEIGPFVFQEYRINDDLEINKDPGIMRYTPKLEKVFLPEESVGDPKDFNITAPSISMLSAAAMLSEYSFVVRQIFNMLVATNNLKPFVNLRIHDQIWGYPDPLIKIANKVVPGLIYFKTVGLFERLYDVDVDYRLEIGTTSADKFSVKKATKIQLKNENSGAKALIDNTYTYNNTFEGAAFTPGMTPETPIHIYRQGICKTFRLQHVAARKMAYGGEGYVYHFHNETFKDRKQCDSKGWCPEGLKDMSSCYFGIPVALSKGHFLDADPRLFEMVEGLKPDRSLHDTEIILDPKIGVGISGSMALQLNLFLGDVSFSPQARRLRDLVLPVANIVAKSPPLIDEVTNLLYLTYTKGPYIVISVQVVCTLLGLFLLAYCGRMMYWIWLIKTDSEKKKKILKQAQSPLLKS